MYTLKKPLITSMLVWPSIIERRCLNYEAGPSALEGPLHLQEGF